MKFISACQCLIISMLLTSSYTQASEFNVNENGVLAHGYDLISYFDGKPVKGSSSYSYVAEGYTLHFASDSNRVRYINDPDTYAPAFGGYCSYGVRMGKKFDIDPLSYAIEDNRLYLLLDRSTKSLWDKDRKRNIGIATRLWPGIQQVSAAQLDSN